MHEWLHTSLLRGSAHFLIIILILRAPVAISLLKHEPNRLVDNTFIPVRFTGLRAFP